MMVRGFVTNIVSNEYILNFESNRIKGVKLMYELRTSLIELVDKFR